MTTEATPITNPYVGPRTFTYAQRHLFFGREREARDLLARVLSERLLLFYAQSGAGKSSLLHTRLIPQLEGEKGFVVLPVARVSGELPAGVAPVDNIYTFNLMLSIDEGDDPARLAHVALTDFFARLTRRTLVNSRGEEHKGWVYDATQAPAPPTTSPNARRYALIVDQFEEIITASPERWHEREIFFRQLDQAMMDDPNLWVVFTLREDYVASLDPYAPLLADRLRARFYMERMGVEAALAAVKQPAALAGRRFTKGVAETLVDNLRRVKVAGQADEQLGQYVEPVQLQVVCYQLWENLRGHPLDFITNDELRDAGNIERALVEYYQLVMKSILADTNLQISEDKLRTWFTTHLITETGTRGFVLRTKSHTGSLPNSVVDQIEQRFLIRRETRAGGIWYELVHDTFVNPILRSNLEWNLQQAPPEIEEFLITPKVISQGADITIQWQTKNAETIRIDPGGLILNKPVGLLRLQAHNQLYPKQTTVYRLTATHSNGVLAASATQEVKLIDYGLDAEGIKWNPEYWEQGLTVLIGSQMDQRWIQPHEASSLSTVLSLSQDNKGNLGEQYLTALAERISLLARQEGTTIDTDIDPDKLSLTSLAMRLGYPSMQSEYWELLRLLAELPVAVYITSSYHTFLEESLKAAGKNPQTQLCRWNDEISNSITFGETEIDWRPSVREPLVFHLYGLDSYPSSLAITEDDYITFLMRVREDRDVVPLAVRYALQRKYNLVLGFDPQSWEFKALYHGLITWNYKRRLGGWMQIAILQDKTASDIKQIEASIAKSGLKLFWGDVLNLPLLVK